MTARATVPVLRVLLVEDCPADADLVAGYLTDGDAGAAVVTRVDRLGRALDVLARERPDVVLLDLSLPDADRLEGIEAVIGAAPQVPIVVMTGLADDEVALAAVKAGAQDYLIKGEDGPRVVRRSIRYAMERQELLAREREARATAERAARARDEALGIVSHDLRTPLSTITMCAQALREPDPDASKLADTIARSAEWGLRIIRDLLDVSAIEAGRLAIYREPMQAGAIAETAQSMFATVAAAEGVELVVKHDGPPTWVEVDVDRLVQAIGNLVANAIRFTPRGGRVSISTATADDGAAVFRVRDAGPGIAPEHLPRLFDRFWQAHEQRRGGAGLGLAIAKGIVEAHGGTIDVRTDVGAGATFTCTIPAAVSPSLVAV
jgi:signal transduction histidine kinase